MTTFLLYNYTGHYEYPVNKFTRIQPFPLVMVILAYLSWKIIMAKTQSLRRKSFDNISSTTKADHLQFPVNIPYLNGFITMLKVRRDGVCIWDDWRTRYGRFYELPFGTKKIFIVSDVAIVQKVLSSTTPLHMNKPEYLYGKVFIEWLRDGLLNADYNVWNAHRKMASRSFTYKSLQTYVKYMNNHSRNLVRDLNEICSKEEKQASGCQVWDLIYFHAIKIIGQIVIGADRLSDSDTSKFYRDFVRLKKMITDRLLNPQLLIPSYWNFHPLRTEYTKMVKESHDYMVKIVEIYRQEFENKNLSKSQMERELVDGGDDKLGQIPFRCLLEQMLYSGATNNQIYNELATFFAAGHETTVTALQFLLVHLASNPIHLKKCQEEVDKLMESDADKALDMDDLSGLVYLKRCILEAQRITPVVPILARQLDAPLEVSENLTIPGNSTVAIPIWAIHRDPEYFPAPDKFDPDRFLTDNVKKRHPMAYIPFSAGPRNCIGYKVSMMEMKVIMTQLLYNFDVYITDKLEDVKLMFEVTLLPERDYNIVLKRRR